jgi:hypothetical protein
MEKFFEATNALEAKTLKFLSYEAVRKKQLGVLAAVLALHSGRTAASGCLKDTRQIKDDETLTRLLDYLCTGDQDAQARVRVQFSA